MAWQDARLARGGESPLGRYGSTSNGGRTIAEVCHETSDIEIAAGLEVPGSTLIGSDMGEVAGVGKLNVHITDDLAAAVDDYDVVIDFTVPQATIANLEQCMADGKRMVIGTTGLNDEQKQAIRNAANEIAIVFAPNMSAGVNLCFKLIELAAQCIGQDADIEIIEAHHREKKDAPSGTSLRMGEIVAHALSRDLNACAIYGREGITGPRDRNSIGFETIRAGDIVGEHTVMFALNGERVEISHKATSRKTFASGAVRAAQWLMHKDKGLFDMQDVLGLR